MVSTDYGDLVDLTDRNAILGECGCCDFPSCPLPTWAWEYKSATAQGYRYTDITLTAPTDCSALFGLYEKIVTQWVYSVTDPPGSPVSGTEVRRTYSATLTVTETKHPFTGAVTTVYSGSGTFTHTNYFDDGGSWSSDFDETWTVSTNGSGTGWQWSYDNSDGDGPESSPSDHTGGADPGNLFAWLDDSAFNATDPYVTAGAPTTGWTGAAYTTTYPSSDAVGTETLTDEWTSAALETAAATYFSGISWTSAGATQHEASRTVTRPDVGATGCTAADHILSWSEKTVRYAATVSANRTDVNGNTTASGTEFDLFWDEAKTLSGPVVTLDPKSFAWVSPASTTDSSHTMTLGSGEYGTLEVANVRYTCYSSAYGESPEYDDSFDTETAT